MDHGKVEGHSFDGSARRIVGMVILAILLLGGVSCGKVASGPINPLIDPPVAYDFEADLQGWTIDTGASVPNTGMEFLHSTERALNSYGSFRANLNFNNAGDKAIVRLLLPSSPVTQTVDLGGRMISCWVFWESGLAGQGSKVGAQLFVKDAANKWANGAFLQLTKGVWNQVIFNTAAPGYDDGADMTRIMEFGLQIVADVGTFTPGVVYIDNYAY